MNQTTNQRIALGLAALASIKAFIGPMQTACVKDLIRGSEERDFYIDKMIELAGRIRTMPVTYQQDGLGDAAVAHLHYFTPGSDFYITEKDMNPEEENPSGYQMQAYGYACVNGEHDMGYIAIPEILAAGAELDFHFAPKSIGRLTGRCAA